MSDGAMLRDRFTLAATHVAARFASDPGVVGFELYNEPPADTPSLAVLYGAMIPALRAAAPQKLLFFEPPATRNILDRAPFGLGSLGAGTVYAPHVYTYVFTGDEATRAAITEAELAPSNQGARAEADSWAAPLVITEYGYSPSEGNFASYVGWQADLQDQNLASSFFWVWKETGGWGFFDYDATTGAYTERSAVDAALSRVRLESGSGRLLSVSFDGASRRFSAQIWGDAGVTAPNIVSVGQAAGFSSYDATCDGAPVPHGVGDPISIPCGGPGLHSLLLTGH